MLISIYSYLLIFSFMVAFLRSYSEIIFMPMSLRYSSVLFYNFVFIIQTFTFKFLPIQIIDDNLKSLSNKLLWTRIVLAKYTEDVAFSPTTQQCTWSLINFPGHVCHFLTLWASFFSLSHLYFPPKLIAIHSQ